MKEIQSLEGAVWCWFAEWCGVALVISTLVFSTIHCPEPLFLLVYYALLAGPLLLALRARRGGGGVGAGVRPFSEAGMVARMKDAQQVRETWLPCTVGDHLRVINFADMAEAAFELSDANWAPSLRAYLGAMGVVQEVDEASVKLLHPDGQTLWWAFGAVKMAQSRPKQKTAAGKGESSRTCACGDVLQSILEPVAAAAAFASCDARWSPSLVNYLGESGFVELVQPDSVLLKHSDGQCVWWPYSALKVVSRAPRPVRTCGCGDMLRTVADAKAAETAFVASDACFTMSMAYHYLDTVGTVEAMDQSSILLRHADGQGLWWPLASLILEVPASQGRAGARKGRQEAAPRWNAAWYALSGYALAVSASAWAFATIYTPHPLFLLLYYGILTGSLASSAHACALLATTDGKAGALCAGAAATLAGIVLLYLSGGLSTPAFLACYYGAFAAGLFLLQTVISEELSAAQAAAKLVAASYNAAARTLQGLLLLAATLSCGILVSVVALVYGVAACARVAGPDAAAFLGQPLLGPGVYLRVAGAADTCSALPLVVVVVVVAGTWVLLQTCSRQKVRLYYQAAGPMQAVVARCPSLLRGFR